jgi:hypothetical protein
MVRVTATATVPPVPDGEPDLAPPDGPLVRVRRALLATPAGARARATAEAQAHRAHRRTTQVLKRLTRAQEPRIWSNREIERVAAGITGDVVHVSAWLDEDKEGRRYRDYFQQARSYTTTNVGGQRGEGGDDDVHLDLSGPLPPHLEQAFDLVFNHTTLEHVAAVDVALDNLFRMARGEVLVVVPFMQVEHWECPSFGDYWRLTEHGLVAACLQRGFEVLSLTSNHNPVWPIYYCLHARRREDGAGAGDDVWSVTGTAPGFGFRPVEPAHPLMM